jgi:hypothetical protein
MTKTEQCPLCQTNCQVDSYTETYNTGKLPTYRVECPVCGEYIIVNQARKLQKRKETLYIISGVTRNYYEFNKSPFIITEKMIHNDSEFQVEFLSKVPKSVLDKASLLLQYIAHKSSHPGDFVRIKEQEDYPVCFCKNGSELRFYINSLTESEDIIEHSVPNLKATYHSFLLTAKGWQKIESMARPNLESKQAFVAMWFDESLKEIFTKGLEPLEEATGFEMYRVDQEPFNEKICDRIIADIRKSRFLIADVTGLRQAVFFEAGYAMGLGLPVIFTCKEGTEIEGCFDTRQYNHIVWKDAEELRSKLRDRILATIGKTA